MATFTQLTKHESLDSLVTRVSELSVDGQLDLRDGLEQALNEYIEHLENFSSFQARAKEKSEDDDSSGKGDERPIAAAAFIARRIDQDGVGKLELVKELLADEDEESESDEEEHTEGEDDADNVEEAKQAKEDGKDGGDAANEDGGDEEEEEEEEEEDDDDELEELKMVLCVRTDLKMTKGKMCAQCGHATLGLYKQLLAATIEGGESGEMAASLLQAWDEGGQAKVALKLPSEVEMDQLAALAEAGGVNSYIISDAGRTQIAAGSRTVLGLGPAPVSAIDEITGTLKLL